MSKFGNRNAEINIEMYLLGFKMKRDTLFEKDAGAALISKDG